GLVLIGVLLGTYGGIWMQQAAFANAKAGPAQTMLSTTPIWILPLAFFAGERVTWRAVAGSVIAVAGVAMLFWNAGAGGSTN
ncbi:MAG: EamA family transporter, partial [Planctomycetota bacterium]